MSTIPTEPVQNTEINIENELPEQQPEKKNIECKTGHCYCGKERNLNIIELLCANCNKWYHESCIGYQLGKLVPFITNYVFVCKNCSPSGLESFRKLQASIPQMCVTAIANMQQGTEKNGKIKLTFSKDKEIIPFIEQYWEAMTTMPRRVTQSWYATVQRALVKEARTLFSYEECNEDGQMFGLICHDLTQIKPNYDALTRGGAIRFTDDGYAQALYTYSKINNEPKNQR